MKDCEASNFLAPAGMSRRQLLGGFGTLALASLLKGEGLLAEEPHRAAASPGGLDTAPKPPHFPAQAKAVIQLVMTGGPSHVDLFDPKRELQKRDGQVYGTKVDAFQPGSETNKLLASPFKFLPSGQCGMELSEVIPHIRSIADDICLVRSMVNEHNNHGEALCCLASGKIFLGRPTLGAWISYALGTENQNLPAFVVLRNPGGDATCGSWMYKSGWMPALYSGTLFNTRGAAVDNLKPARPIPAGAQQRGLDFLAKLNEDHRRRYPEESELETRIRNYELAARMQMTATEVLDVSRESAATRKLYGLDHSDPYAAAFASRCLMARRLLESGVRFVQLFTGQGQPWDHHDRLKEGIQGMARATDQASAALIKDLKRRGLLDSTIVLWAGEFGRMPVSQNGSGRDHNMRAGSLWLAGGGFKGGYVHGKTDDVGYTVVENRLTMPDLFATIAHQFGIDHRKLTYRHAGREEDMTDSPVTKARIHAEVLKKGLLITG